MCDIFVISMFILEFLTIHTIFIDIVINTQSYLKKKQKIHQRMATAETIIRTKVEITLG
jgi:hypothetical protein